MEYNIQILVVSEKISYRFQVKQEAHSLHRSPEKKFNQ